MSDPNLEPELETQILPRRLGPRSLLAMSDPLMAVVLVFLFGAISCDTIHTGFQRAYLLAIGREGTAVVHKAYYSGPKGRTAYVDLWYEAADGLNHVLKAHVGDLTKIEEGQSVPIHFRVDHPDEAVIDDDYGYFFQSVANCFLIIILGGASLWWATSDWYKQRHIVLWGTVVRAIVTRIDPDRKQIRLITLAYQQEGRQIIATTKLRRGTVAIGDMVSAFVHPRYPGEVVVYRASPWIVLKPVLDQPPR